MKTAIIALSKIGLEKAQVLCSCFPGADIYAPERLAAPGEGAGMAGGSGAANEPIETAGGKPEKTDRSGDSEVIEGGSNFRSSCEKSASSLLSCSVGVPVLPLKNGFAAAAAGIFESYNAIIFISAVAVAVRGIAPCLAGKAKDPAVVVIDEGGRYAISLLSGHLGGANDLAAEAARCLGAEAVITTATDGRGLPAFDNLARKWGWGLEYLPALKHISAALLEGREIVLYSCRPFTRHLEGRIYCTERAEDLSRARHGAVLVTNRLEPLPLPAGVPQVILRPRNLAVGVGCRRGIAANEIVRAVKEAFAGAGLAEESISCLATGEFKEKEEGLIEAARFFGVPLKIFTREEIRAAVGSSATSEFVQKQVGVGAVAEPCAVLGSGGGPIVLPVRRHGGITIALAEGELFPGEA